MDGQRHALTALLPGKTVGTYFTWASGPVWMATENVAPIGVRAPGLPPRDKSLSRLPCSERFKLAYKM